MRFVGNMLLKGIIAVLPIGLTLYLVYWLAITIEGLLHPVMVMLVTERFYVPGMGLLSGLVLLFLIGLVVNAWIIQRLFAFGEAVMQRIPLVKSVYGALRDFMDFFSTASKRQDLQSVVLVTVNDMQLIGFLTRDQVRDIPAIDAKADDMVAVYLPMSYQIGGYTVYLPRSRVEVLEIGVEDAMRMVLTAGMSK